MLKRAYQTLAGDVRTGRFVTSASEWLLDNFHLIAAQIADVRRNLPRTYYRQLPALASREHAGRPRVYAMAIELVRHGDGRFDRQELAAFLNSYQRIAPLTIGELWAWPSMLTLALVENLRRLADEILTSRDARLVADDYILRAEADAPAGVARDGSHRLDRPVAAAHARVRTRGARAAPGRRGASGRAADDGRGSDSRRTSAAGRHAGLGRQRDHEPAAVLGDRLARLRRERESGRARAAARSGRRLRAHGFPQPRPAAARRRADRRAYRGSAGAAGPESDRVRARGGRARLGIRSVGACRLSPRRPRPRRSRGRRRVPAGVRHAREALRSSAIATAHLPGIDYRGRRAPADGRRRVDSARRSRLPHSLRTRSRRSSSRLRVSPCLRSTSRSRSCSGYGRARSRPAPAAAPRLSRTACPRTRARWSSCPTLLTSTDGVASLLEHLEVLAYGNLDPHIHFAILSDFVDAPSAVREEDEPLLAAARDGILDLNRPVRSATTPDRFFLFHRDRRWNPRERIVDGMGAQARQDRRVQPPAARRRRTRRSRRRWANWTCCRACATASRSTPTRGCRAMPRSRSSASSRIRSIGPRSIRRPAASPRATPSCSRASA